MRRTCFIPMKCWFRTMAPEVEQYFHRPAFSGIPRRHPYIVHLVVFVMALREIGGWT